MKKTYLVIVMLLACITMLAQVPAGFSYQAVVRNTSGEIVANQTVKFRFSIFQSSLSSTAVYVETQSVTTNAFGLANMNVGTGTPVSGSLNPALWGDGDGRHFLKVEIDPNNGNAFSLLSTVQLMSVPYAFHAQTVESISDNSVTSSKIVNGAVTAPKLANMGAASGQVLTFNGSTWAPQSFDANPWLKSASDIYFSSGKVGIGKIPGADLTQFQVLTSDSPAMSAFNNSATYASIYVSNEGTGPAAEFRSRIRILDGMQGAGKVLTSDAIGVATWQTPAASPWQKIDNHIFYNGGYVGIGTSATDYPLTIENNSNTSYIKMKDNQGTGGVRIGVYNGQLALINDNVNQNIRFSINSGSGYFQMMTIDAANKRVGILTATPDASLDVKGTMVVGILGKTFSEIREITGTTGGSGGSTSISYPSGYTMSNMRVLSLEINYRGTGWIGLGGNQQNATVTDRVFYYLGSSLYIYYPNISDFQGRAFRMMVMKVQ